MSDTGDARERTLTIKVSREQFDVIDQVARLSGKSRSAFVSDAAYREAQELLLDQTVFTLDEEAFSRFEATLDAPPAPNERLRALMSAPSPWE